MTEGLELRVGEDVTDKSWVDEMENVLLKLLDDVSSLDTVPWLSEWVTLFPVEFVSDAERETVNEYVREGVLFVGERAAEFVCFCVPWLRDTDNVSVVD